MTQPTRAAVQDALRQAQMSFNQGNFSAAEPIYKQMVESIPPESEEYALCLHNLGEINEQRGNLTTSIWWQMRLVSHDLMQSEGMRHHLFARMGHIAALYTKAGRPSEANQLYQQMLSLRPQLPPGPPQGFQPQTEIGTFLRGVLDAIHKRYSNDTAETQQINDALNQLQQSPAQVSHASPLDAFQPPTTSAAQDSGAATYQNQQMAPEQLPGRAPASESNAWTQQMNTNFQSQGNAAQPMQIGGAAPKPFDPSELESIASPGQKAKASASRNYQEELADSDQREETGSAGAKGGRGRRVGIGEVEEAPTEMDSKLEGLANGWTAISNSKFAPIVFLTGFGLGLFVLFHLPYQGNPARQFKTMHHQFQTVDGSKLLELTTAEDCVVILNKEKTTFPYKFYFGDLREAAILAGGQLPEKQYWLNDEKSIVTTERGQSVSESLVDDKGSTFYDQFGPEPKLFKAMNVISDAVSMFYNSRGSKYPASAGDIGAEQLQYENPYTNKIEVANIQSIAVGENSKKGDTARGEFYENLSLGKGWDQERKLTPGAINCCSVQINTSRGPIQAFVMQAGDANGKPIMGANAGLYFYKALEDGKPQEMLATTTPFFADGTMRKRVIVICEKPIDSTLSFIIRNSACWLFTILAFLSGCILLSLSKRSGSKPVAIVFIAIFGIAAALYTLSGRF